MQNNINFNHLPLEDIREKLMKLNTVTLAKQLEPLLIEDICEIFYIVHYEKAAELFSYLPLSIQSQLIHNLNPFFVKMILEYVYTDDIVDFLEECPSETKQLLLKLASDRRRLQIILQLRFNENSAGSIMSADFVELDENDSALEALTKIKTQEKIAETISYCYVTNHHHMLIGCVSMKDVLIAPDDTKIKDIMDIDVVSVDIDDDQEKVANKISKYDLLAIPVVNDYHHIMGIITIDDVLDIIESETTEDIQKMVGITPGDGSYLQMSNFKIAKSRILWLLILMVSASVSGFIIASNVDVTLKLPSLLIFIPMLMDTAGNAGSQSSAMVIRGIIIDNLNIHDFFKIFKKEFINSLILGGILFIVNMLRILIFMQDVSWQIGLLISITIYIIVTIANLIGGLLPLLATQFKIDPASMSGPVLTTVCDAISLTTYFTLATLYLGGVIL